MRQLFLLSVAVIAFVAVAFVPGGAAGDGGTFSNHSAQPSGGEGKAGEAQFESYAAWSAGETTLDRSGDGHFYAQVSVNGMPVETLVDTGASVVALTTSDASTLGLSWNDSDMGVIGSGASGPVVGVRVKLDRVELGGHEAQGVDAVIIPDGLEISLLGQSFLSTIDPVRIEGDRMVLGG